MTYQTSSYWTFTELPRPQDIEDLAHAEVLVADSRLDQSLIRAAVDEVFEANPTLGSVFEPWCDRWMARPGGSWAWAVEPPGATVAEVIARQRSAFDMRLGRLFGVSLLPGTPDRLVLTASHLCVDDESWQAVVEEVVTAYDAGQLEPEADRT
ncbi:hypothetical protein BST27_20600 [Mycobacterium intermedium]|uniref:Condensation domain-containing protein n=1 Tax=Mycobacterium intermedium TaxID=28445 RepID=A0A1E3SB38_MYCIE|nr:hypothetical protein [Mycobacterium intermedium]MCV6962284.1 hypothetical protein [Mycobacterium intermedium]ODQ99375.1 hypothetical protein BHQ20_17845 [Mycobacterium intermedium]OPE51148.1 hypothetical protein BV508_07475 [Mycobacterium intermedium]ORA98519.1 hypothetical protein BST27_20600 [Mycobacterium intermedium]